MSIKAGFLGYAIVDGIIIRCNDFSLNPKQDVLFYDHIVGLRDSIPSSIFSGKGDIGNLNIQRKVMRPGVKICQGGINYPMIESDPLYMLAKTADDFDLSFNYSCNSIKRTFINCKVNNYNFTITSGDFATVSVDIIAQTVSESESGADLYNDEIKMITWDSFSISTPVIDSFINSFSLTINNNCNPVYTAGANNVLNLNPLGIRVGMQEISGTISYYSDCAPLAGVGEPTTIQIASTGISEELNVVFKPQEINGSIGPMICPLNFVGINYALGE
jgi:hypothetical protein